MTLYLNESPARLDFKKILGNANQLIITALVGLDAIERGAVTAAPPDLHAVWSPRDPVTSARRSRRLILDMALVRAVDSLDVYVRRSRRRPILFQAVGLQSAIDGNAQSISAKLRAITQHYVSLDRRLVALMELMVAWRNRAAHMQADIELKKDQLELLQQSADWIAHEFRAMSVDRMLQDFDADNPPTFRETASLLHATQKFVEALEIVQFGSLDAQTYLREVIWEAISKVQNEQTELDKLKKKKLQSIWGKDKSERGRTIERFLTNIGLSKEQSHPYSVLFDDALIELIAAMSPSAMYDWCKQN